MRCGRRGFLVEDPDRRRREVVELAALRRPDVGRDEHDRQHDRERHEQIEHAHVAAAEKVRLRQAPSTAVKELSGIRIAATSGSSAPVIASATAIAL